MNGYHMQENGRAVEVGGGRCDLFRGRFDPRDRRETFSVNRHVNRCVHLHCILLHGEAHNRGPEVIQTTQRGQPRGWGSLRPNGSIADPGDDLSPDPLSAAATIAHGKGHPRRRPPTHRYVHDIHNEIITLGFERGQDVFGRCLA